MTTYVVTAIIGTAPANLRGSIERIGSTDMREAAEQLASDWVAIHGGETSVSPWTQAEKDAHMARLRPNNGRRNPRRMTAEESAAFNA